MVFSNFIIFPSPAQLSASCCSRIDFELHGACQTLIRVGGEQFREMASCARHDRISTHD
jgi:hypothetical protein